jgi:hypothetical protein
MRLTRNSRQNLLSIQIVMSTNPKAAPYTKAMSAHLATPFTAP